MRCMAFCCCLLVAASPAVSHGSEPNGELDALRKDIMEIKDLLLTLRARVEAFEDRLSSITSSQPVLKVEVEASRSSGPYLRFPIEIERAMMHDAFRGQIHPIHPIGPLWW